MNSNNRSIVSLLSDLSFSQFITTRVITIVYILGLAACGIGALTMLLGALSMMRYSGLLGLGYLVGVILTFCLSVLLLRMALEFVVVIFKMAENMATLANKR